MRWVLLLFLHHNLYPRFTKELGTYNVKHCIDFYKNSILKCSGRQVGRQVGRLVVMQNGKNEGSYLPSCHINFHTVCENNCCINWPIPVSFFFIFVFSIQLIVNVQYNFLPMTAFEPETLWSWKQLLYQLSRATTTVCKKLSVFFDIS